MTAGSARGGRRSCPFLLSSVLGFIAVGGSLPAAEAPYEWRLPPGFPAPMVPAGNPMSTAKVELGRHLFYDTRLSANGTQACASCHRQAMAFTDGRARAVGSTGQIHRRNTMSLTNVAYNSALTWADPGLRRLEGQVLIPMLGDRPVELGLEETQLVARLASDPWYAASFRDSFPGEPAPVTLANVTKALASFERTLISGESPYDRLVYQGRRDALSESAWRGMRLFFSDRLACSKCHAGINFSGPIAFEGHGAVKPEFHNTGLYDLDGRGAYPPGDTGLEAVTHRRRDMGCFRAPTLRNIVLTAPYMHDGSIRTLDEVIDHYAAGGRAGNHGPRTSPLLRGFRLSGEEKRDLGEFLRSLTDETFVTDPRFGDPWESREADPEVMSVGTPPCFVRHGCVRDRRTSRVEECTDGSVHSCDRRGTSPQVLRREDRIETQGRIRGRCDLRMWQGFLGLHVPVSGSGHVEGQYGILGRR